MMRKRRYETSCGTICYWVSVPENRTGISPASKPQLVFLPGLTADHRLFIKQISYFDGKYSLFVWDAPGHADSWPFSLTFSLMDKAEWLDEILRREGFHDPILIGQSMGGYVGQAYMQRFPGRLKGFISIDSTPLQKGYLRPFDLWLMKRTEAIYRLYPWKALLRDGVRGVAETDYGRALMRRIMMTYEGDKERYVRLAGHGYRILAQALEADLPCEIDCPAVLICGKQDHAGFTGKFNQAWHARTGLPLEWVDGAGHNSNTDQPEAVNRLIEKWVREWTQRT